MNVRQKAILDKLRKAGKVLIDEEAKRYDVSDMTIRRDLQMLEDRGFAVRIHGGAIYQVKKNTEILPSSKTTEIQKKIAHTALGTIGSAETIMLSVGTTTLEIARQLAVSDIKVTVITNSLSIASALFQTDIPVILTGGTLRMQSMDLVGPITEKNLSEFHVDILFSGCDGVVSDEGFFTTDINLASMERKTVEIADRVIVVTESIKFTKKALVKFASLDDVSTVITDKEIPAPARKNLKKSGIEVITV